MAEAELSNVQEFRLAVRKAQAALDAVDDALAVTGGRLESLSVRLAPQGSEATLRLGGVSDAAAHRLAARLRTRPGVTEVRLEHLWLRP